MDEQMIQRLIEAQNKSVRVLEEIAQLIARLDKRTPSAERQNVSTNPEASFTSVNLPSQINITNVPLPVNIENQPISVEQSGSWSVNINGQPIQVSQSGTWSVTVTNFPLTVAYSTVQYATISATNSGDTQIVPAVTDKRIRVIAYAVVASATVSIKFRSGTTDITGSMRIVEGGGIAHAYDGGLFETAVNQPLNINLSTNATVGGYVVYREVS
jgi:hypothetical protein